MVRPFQFARLPLIIFGYGRLSELPASVMKYGKKILLITGKFSFLTSAPGNKFSEAAKEKGIKPDHLTITGEPSPGMIDEASAQYRNVPPDVVVAVGGGSAIDAGKAISAMIPLQGNVKEYLEGVGYKEHPGTKIPFIAVPTTSGTGSEATKNAVISQVGKEGFKKSLRHDNLVPDIAVIDPELTLSCPQDITAASGMDCFTQLTEAYLSDKANDYTDALAFEGLKAIKSSLVRSYYDGQDIDARTGMSFAALTSGICLANAGLGVIHGFASSVGGMFEIPHGVVCGTLMAVSNEVIVRRLREGQGDPAALKKYAMLGRLFLGDANRADDYFIDGFIEYLNHLTDELQLPGFKKWGITETDLKEIALITECKNNPVKLETDELMEILSRRLM
jgi:alcohol dehydrogenase class IV